MSVATGGPDPRAIDGDVVALVDHGSETYDVLRSAALVAGANRRRLVLVHVVREVEWLLDPRPVEQLREIALHRAATLLDDALGVIETLAPTVEVRVRLLHGSLYGALAGEASSAWMLVVGRGRGRDSSADGHSADGHSADGHSADGNSADGDLARWLEQSVHCPVLVPGHPAVH